MEENTLPDHRHVVIDIRLCARPDMSELELLTTATYLANHIGAFLKSKNNGRFIQAHVNVSTEVADVTELNAPHTTGRFNPEKN